MRVALLLVLLGACVDHGAPITGTQSLAVKIVTPTDLGTIDRRIPQVPGMPITVSVTVTALDANNVLDPTYNNSLQVYVRFLGTLTPYLGGSPLATIAMSNGTGAGSVKLPPVFGPTTLWLDDGTDANPTSATGVTDTIWFRDPFISDIERPANEMSLDALDVGPLDTKNIDVRSSRYGTKGRLVVTSAFSNGYTVADVGCQDDAGTPPCTAQDYDYVEVFSFSAPQDQDRRFLSRGQVIDGFAGGVTEFDGLTEIGFPQTFVSNAIEINAAREPAPVKMDPTWFTNKIMFERNEGGAIEIDGGKVCPLDADYMTHKQWKIDPAGVADSAACGGKSLINVISTAAPDVDPAMLVGKTLTKVVGMLRPINIGSFDVWIIYPRAASDFTN